VIDPATLRSFRLLLFMDNLQAAEAFRRAKSIEYPDDQRNARSSEALAPLSAYVQALPDDDPRVIYLRHLRPPEAETDPFRRGQRRGRVSIEDWIRLRRFVLCTPRLDRSLLHEAPMIEPYKN
jgi:hypothetical protein